MAASQTDNTNSASTYPYQYPNSNTASNTYPGTPPTYSGTSTGIPSHLNPVLSNSQLNPQFNPTSTIPGNYQFNNGLNSVLPPLSNIPTNPTMLPNSQTNIYRDPYMNRYGYNNPKQYVNQYETNHYSYGMPDVPPTIDVHNLRNNVIEALHRNDVNAVRSIVLLTIQANIDSIQYENESRLNTSLTVNTDMINQSGLDQSIKTVVLTELKCIQSDYINKIQLRVDEAKRSTEGYKTLAEQWVTLTPEVAKNQIVNQMPKIQPALEDIINKLKVYITPIADHAAGYIDRFTRDSLINSRSPFQVCSNYVYTGNPLYGTGYATSATSAYGITPTTNYPNYNYAAVSGYNTPATSPYANYATGQTNYFQNQQQSYTGTAATGATTSTYSGTV